MMPLRLLFSPALLVVFAAVTADPVHSEDASPAHSEEISVGPMKIEKSPFGTSPDGHEVTKFTLVNGHGHHVSVMNWGASLLEVHVPDRSGERANVNLAFDSLEGYLRRHPYFGSTVGRFCNRIGEGTFTIDGVQYQVTRNHGKHHLHGGEVNFSRRWWSAEPYESGNAVGVRFSLTSDDGEEGFPGTLRVDVDYRWNDANELTIRYTATTDGATHVNLTNHSYWNLAGAGSGSALDHVVKIEADESLDVDGDLIPTGELTPVDGTPLDFRTPQTLGARVAELPATKGYDHCYVVRGEPGTLRPAARVVDPASGRVLELETTQPGVQLYTANHLPGDENSAGYGGHEAFCLETQHYPNAPNRPSFPSTLLRPGETLEETTVHRFSVSDQ